MKKSRGCVKGMVIAFLITVVALLGLCALATLYLYPQAQRQFEPPTIIVTEPEDGEPVFAGEFLSISAIALGTNPIARVELWLDGELKETQDSMRPGGNSHFPAHFDVLVSEGAHTIFVRAVDTIGMTGQSLPIGVVGVPRPSPAPVLVTVNAGETLADIAEAYDIEPSRLQELNPDLGGKEPAAGTVIKVPAPVEESEPSDVSGAPPTAPPTPAPGGAPPTAPPTPASGGGSLQIPNTPPLKVATPPLIPLPIFLLPSSPPAAPTGLKAQIKECKVTLVWNDNATNEDRYEVWMSGWAWQTTPGLVALAGAEDKGKVTLLPRLIATLNPAPGGTAWVEFNLPSGGGDFNFWVEAANLLGKKPSNIVSVQAPKYSCGSTASYLVVRWTQVSFSGSYDKAYCYFSFEGKPEVRLPPTGFIDAKPGKSGLPLSVSYWVFPIPSDQSLDVEIKCLGWAGATLNNLGTAKGQYPASTWNGAEQSLGGNAYKFGLTIRLWGDLNPTVTVGYKDASLPVPYDVREETYYSPSGGGRRVTWKWNGDKTKLTGFTVYLNGVAYKSVGANQQEVPVKLPSTCGKQVRWEVAAQAGQLQSSMSAPFKYDQPKCQVYALVRFDRLYFECTAEGLHTCPRKYGSQWCDDLDAYYKIWVNDVTRSFWGGNFFQRVNCKITANFEKMGAWYAQTGKYPSANEILIPITTDDIDLRIGTKFWDYDTWSADDLFVDISEHFYEPSLEHAISDWGCNGYTFDVGRHINDSAIYRGPFATVKFYPNPCEESPPGIGPTLKP